MGRKLGRAVVLAALLLGVPFGDTASWAIPVFNPVIATDPIEDDEVVPIEQIHRFQHSNPLRQRDQRPHYGRRHHQRDLSEQPNVHHAASMMYPPCSSLTFLNSPLRC